MTTRCAPHAATLKLGVPDRAAMQIMSWSNAALTQRYQYPLPSTVWPGQGWRKRGDSNLRSLAGRSFSSSAPTRSGVLPESLTCGFSDGCNIRKRLNAPELVRKQQVSRRP